ncbi:uncharacterized protein LOC135829516 [Sycon ciliatum]|uniref:uncharacterized protein LOC135829516 n=1 Tax=Sycon ciliatum TaxID=27933 RepID=UPI0031F67C8D
MSSASSRTGSVWLRRAGISLESMAESGAAFEFRRIVLIGRTGSGKSTLCNVLAGGEDIHFHEEDSAKSVTQHVKSQRFPVKYGEKTLIFDLIDTVGFGDTELSTEKVLEELANLAVVCKGGIHQVIFVTNNRFTDVERECLDLVQSVVFARSILPYMCVVRTRCDDFEDDETVARIKSEMQGLSDILKEVDHFFLVNNPPFTSRSTTKKRRTNTSIRQASRKKILAHLVENCTEVFNPPKLVEIVDTIEDHLIRYKKLETEYKMQVEREEALKGALKESHHQLKEQSDRHHDERQDLQKKLDHQHREKEDLQKKLDDQATKIQFVVHSTMDPAELRETMYKDALVKYNDLTWFDRLKTWRPRRAYFMKTEALKK